MSAEFGGPSRNALIGVWHRLKAKLAAKGRSIPQAGHMPVRLKKPTPPPAPPKPRPPPSRPATMILIPGGAAVPTATTHPNDFKARAEQRAASPGIEQIERAMEQTPHLQESRRLTLTDLELRQCKWPTSGTGIDARFCGHDTGDVLAVYCTAHRRMAYTPANTRRTVSQKQPLLTSGR
jgi:GcrA cell cycle regulator